MKTTLYIVVDSSGSMVEGAKHLIARGVVRAMEQYFRLGYGSADLRLIKWNNEAQVVEWNPNEEFPPEILVCKKSVKAKVLISLLEELPEGKVLIITDGFWSRDDTISIKHWKDSLRKDRFRILKIGADANPRLKGADVFDAEDLFVALDGWLDGGGA